MNARQNRSFPGSRGRLAEECSPGGCAHQLKLTVQKGHRETLIAEIGLLGGTKNIDDKAVVTF
jgi:hypothetical protein